MLEITDIKERVLNPRKKAEISQANNHEERIRFHSETALSAQEAGRAATVFLSYVEALIPFDKFQIFKGLFKYPIKTINVTGQAYEALQKIFDGRNPVYRDEFLSADEKADWKDYRTKALKSPHIWRTRGFDAMKTAINSVLIVDLPTQQTGSLPEPYFYWLPISRVVDYDENDGTITAIIFTQADGSYAVFDDTFLRVFESKDKQIGALRSEVRHELGYCPARFFWETPLSFRRPDLKRSPISDSLADLDWLLFFMTSKQHLDLYAPYPIYSGFEQDCDYTTGPGETEGGERLHCYRGYLRNERDEYTIGLGGGLRECPICSKKRIAGVGSFVEIPPPSPENDKADLRNPVQITTIDRQSLDYNVSEVERLEARFLLAVTGYEGELLRNQALNEKQVGASFESRTNILWGIKKNFEAAQEWVDGTVCRLRYNTFQGVSISYGTDFYLETADSLLTEYLDAKEKKADSTTLDSLQDQYFETKFRNNPDQLARENVIKNLDPFRHLDPEQVLNLYDKGLIEYEDFFLKTNFSTLLLRFERENGSLLEFGTNKEFPDRVAAIREALLSYIEEPGEEDETPEPGPEPEPEPEPATGAQPTPGEPKGEPEPAKT